MPKKKTKAAASSSSPAPPPRVKVRRLWRDTPSLAEMNALRDLLGSDNEGQQSDALRALCAIATRLRPINHGQGGPPRWPDLELLDEARELLSQVLPTQYARFLYRRT